MRDGRSTLTLYANERSRYKLDRFANNSIAPIPACLPSLELFDIFDHIHRSTGGECDVAREDLRRDTVGLYETRLGAATVSLLYILVKNIFISYIYIPF